MNQTKSHPRLATAWSMPSWIRHFHTPEAGTIIRLSTPIALVAMVNMIMSITDTFMVAFLGHEKIAAVAVGSDFYTIMFFLAMGLLAGLSPAYAEAWKLRDKRRLALLRTVGWVLLIIALVPTVPIIWFAPDYLSLLGIAPEILDEGRGYTQALSLTLIPMLVVALYRNRLTALEKPNNILKITLAAIPINAALNWVFIFGWGDWAGFGTTGAGISSLFTGSFIAIGLAWLSHREGDSGLSRWIDMRELRSAARIGWPIGVATLAEVGIFLGATLFVAAVAPAEAAAHVLVLRLAGFAYAIPVGLLQVSMVRMARLGINPSLRRKRRVIASASTVALGAGIMMFLILSALAFPLADLVLGGLAKNVELVKTATLLIIILAIIELFEPMGTTSAGLLRGARDTQIPMVYSLIGNWGISLPIGLTLTLAFDAGAIGVWIGMGIGNIAASIMIASRIPRHWSPKASVSGF